MSLAAGQRLVGTTQELLIESPSRTDATRWSARTRGNHLVHLPTPDGWRAGSGQLPAYGPGDLVTATVLEGAHNYAVADAPTTVRRTAAGRATAEALARGEGHQLPGDAPATPPVGRALPLLVTASGA